LTIDSLIFQIRNNVCCFIVSFVAELIKISTCAELRVFDLLDEHCEALIKTGFGRFDGYTKELREAADEINKRGIRIMLQLEAPNLRELNLFRVIAFGHTVSPTLELTPDPPLRHGHAISVDMAYFTTLAWKRGLVSDTDHKRVLNLFSRAGLTMDHELFDETVLKKGIKAIYGVRDGYLHAAIPAPLGSCTFVEDVTEEEFNDALRVHKEICKEYPRGGAGLDAYVDASDTGVPEQDDGEREILKKAAEKAKTNGHLNGTTINGTTNGHTNGYANGHTNGYTNGTTNGHTNGNGYVSHTANGYPKPAEVAPLPSRNF